MQQCRRKKTKVMTVQLKAVQEKSCTLKKSKLEQLLSTRRQRPFDEVKDYFQSPPAFRPANNLITLQNYPSYKQTKFNKCKDSETKRLYESEIFQTLLHSSSQSYQSRKYASPSGKGTIIFLKARTINPVGNFIKAKSMTPAKRSFHVRKKPTQMINKNTSNCFRANYPVKNICSLELKDIKLEASKSKSKSQEELNGAQKEKIKGWSFKYLNFQTEIQMP